VCGAPRALGESIVFLWGDALGLAYVGVVCPDSSFREMTDGVDRVPSTGSYPRGSAPVGMTLTRRAPFERSTSRTAPMIVAVIANERVSSCHKTV
jgi:hypothetical protein